MTTWVDERGGWRSGWNSLVHHFQFNDYNFGGFLQVEFFLGRIWRKQWGVYESEIDRRDDSLDASAGWLRRKGYGEDVWREIDLDDLFNERFWIGGILLVCFCFFEWVIMIGGCQYDIVALFCSYVLFWWFGDDVVLFNTLKWVYISPPSKSLSMCMQTPKVLSFISEP